MYFNKLIFFIIITFTSLVLQANKIEKIVWKSPLPFKNFKKYIKIKKGEEFSIKKIRRSIKLIYYTGKIKQIIVVKQRNTLIFISEPLFLISKITITGNQNISDRKILMAGNLRKFAPFYQDNLQNIQEEISYLYKKNGFFNTTISIETEKKDAIHLSLKIKINEGKQQNIKQIKLSGINNPNLKTELQYLLNTTYKGEPFSDSKILEAKNYAEDFLTKRGFSNIKFTHKKLKNGKIEIILKNITKLTIKIKGNKSFSTKTIKEIFSKEKDNEADLEKIKTRIETFYQLYGFPFAKVLVSHEIKKENKIKREIIEITIQENKRQFIRNVVFTGVTFLSTKILKNFIKEKLYDLVKEKEFPTLVLNRSTNGGGYKIPDNQRIKADKRSKKDKALLPPLLYSCPKIFFKPIKKYLKTVFVLRGFKDVKINDIKLKTYKKQLFLSIDITENKRYTLSKTNIFFDNKTISKALKQDLKLKTGVPYSQELTKKYKKIIQNYLRNKGAFFVDIKTKVNFNKNKVNLTIFADNLLNVKLGEIVIKGNAVTDTNIIRRMLHLKTGEKLTKTKIEKTKINLLHSGLFDSVSINLIDPNTPNTEKDIVVSVQESDRFLYSPGIGISTDEGIKLFGKFEWKNVGRKGFILNLKYSIGRSADIFMPDNFEKYYEKNFSFFEKIYRNISLGLLIPDIFLFPFPVSMQTEIFNYHDLRSNAGMPYMIDKTGIYNFLYKKFNDKHYLSIGAEYYYLGEKDVVILSNVSNKNFSYQNMIISPELRGYLDFRNNIFFPTQGFKISLDLTNKNTLLGNGASLLKIENAISIYIPLFYYTNAQNNIIASKKFIFHTYWKYGLLFKFSGKLLSDDLLKLGGSTTIRGFAQDSILPADNPKNTGQGKAYAFARNELMFQTMDKVYLVTFLDMGNLWEDLNNIGKTELLRYGTGGGIMIVSPIGSINFQLGINLSPKLGEDRLTFHIFIASF